MLAFSSSIGATSTTTWPSEWGSSHSIGSFSVASIDSNDDTILSSDLDPMTTVQEALDYFQREIDEFGK